MSDPQDAAKHTPHTPGPWTIEQYGDDETPALVIHRDSESRVCFMATPGSRGDPEQIEADARLIALCPEFFELAKAVVDHFEGTDARLGEWARELVAKAKGAA